MAGFLKSCRRRGTRRSRVGTCSGSDDFSGSIDSSSLFLMATASRVGGGSSGCFFAAALAHQSCLFFLVVATR